MIQQSLKYIFLFATFMSLQSLPGNAAVFIGSYEVSYIYNTLSSNASFSPIGPVEYSAGLFSNSIVIPSLDSGDYQIKIAPGRESGNAVDPAVFNAAVGPGSLDSYWTSLVEVNNPAAPKYQSGFDGGNTNPSNFPDSWFYGTAFWIGDSEVSGAGDRIFGLGTTHDFSISSGENLWLFWNDNYSKDNLGGATIELWQTSPRTVAVPEPGSLVLLGAGILGTLLKRNKKRLDFSPN